MARTATVVVPFYPHPVTQRGHRRQRTLFGDDNDSSYVELMSGSCRKAGTLVRAYCLMPNHLVMVPSHADGLRAALAREHSDAFRKMRPQSNPAVGACERTRRARNIRLE
jgi:putative transposase